MNLLSVDATEEYVWLTQFFCCKSDRKLKKEEKKRDEIEDEVRAKKKEQGQVNRELASLENKYQLLVSTLLFCMTVL